MSIAHAMLAEFEHEAKTTRKFLERIPQDKLGWKPHEKYKGYSIQDARLKSNVQAVAAEIRK